jgi:hypothetical protein
MINERQVPLNLAEAGMQLTRPASNVQGVVLIPNGVTLDAACLDLLDRGGVTDIWISIVITEQPVLPIGDSPASQPATDCLSPLFRQVANTAEGKELLNLLIRYRKGGAS